MKKLILGGVIALAVMAVLGFAGVAFVNAQSPTPQGPGGWQRGFMMGGDRPMHEYMEEAIAEKLGMTVEELEEQYASGLSMWQIAEAQGLSAEEITTLMNEARSEALDAMVADGVITQEQADWMKERGGAMMGGFGGRGGCGMWGAGTDPQSGAGGWGRGRRGPGMMNGFGW